MAGRGKKLGSYLFEQNDEILITEVMAHERCGTTIERSKM